MTFWQWKEKPFYFVHLIVEASFLDGNGNLCERATLIVIKKLNHIFGNASWHSFTNKCSVAFCNKTFTVAFTLSFTSLFQRTVKYTSHSVNAESVFPLSFSCWVFFCYLTIKTFSSLRHYNFELYFLYIYTYWII